jgi:hypothetical protein
VSLSWTTNFSLKAIEIFLALQLQTNHVLQRAGNEEVLLLEPQLCPASVSSFGYSTLVMRLGEEIWASTAWIVVAGVESGKIEFSGASALHSLSRLGVFTP